MRSRRLVALISVVVLSACNTVSTGTLPTSAEAAFNAQVSNVTRLPSQPVLISLNTSSGRLEYWPISAHASNQPIAFSKPIAASYVANAYGQTVVLVDEHPNSIVLYDTKTGARHRLADRYGTPIDVAVDASHNLYVLNLVKNSSNVIAYRGASLEAMPLTCAQLGQGSAIAADNAGNVFVNSYLSNGLGVIEIPNQAMGAKGCQRLHLRSESGYVGGIAVDPKTGDLIVVDNPDDCAGGIEGEMIIYPHPYAPNTGIVRQLDATYCATGIRLNETSTLVFFGDSTVSAGVSLIAQRTYPGAKGAGIYSGGNPGGFAVIRF